MPERMSDAVSAALAAMADPGDRWSGAERLAIAATARAAFADRHRAPWMREAPPEGVVLTPEVAAIVRTLAADLHLVDRDWAKEAIAVVGEVAYVELVALVSSLAIVDAFGEATGDEAPGLPAAPMPGDPVDDELPYDVGDIGAYVPMRTPWPDANVGRALTLAPSGNGVYRALAMAMYHDGEFYDLAWNRTLSRPQTEVLATAVSAAHECFY
ncbi:MAG: hypothetical protein AAGA99_00950 [Actinomycetota bacterium]